MVSYPCTRFNRNGLALSFASDDLRGDKVAVSKAAANDVNALEYASTDLKSDREFITDMANLYGVKALEFALSQHTTLVSASLAHGGLRALRPSSSFRERGSFASDLGTVSELSDHASEASASRQRQTVQQPGFPTRFHRVGGLAADQRVAAMKQPDNKNMNPLQEAVLRMFNNTSVSAGRVWHNCVLDKANETAMSQPRAVGSLPCTAVPPPPSPPLSPPWMGTRALETRTCRVARADMDKQQLIRMSFGDIGRDAKDANFPFSPECERAVATFLTSSMLHVALAALAAACPFLSGIYMAPWACAALVVGSLLVVGHLAFGGRLTARLGATLLVAGYGLNLVYVWAVVDAMQLIERMDEIKSKPLAIIAGVISFGAWLGAQPSDYLSPKLKLCAAAILTALAAARSIIVWVRTGRYIAEIALCAGQFNIGVLVAMYTEFRKREREHTQDVMLPCMLRSQDRTCLARI